jgi:acylphosphatase
MLHCAHEMDHFTLFNIPRRLGCVLGEALAVCCVSPASPLIKSRIRISAVSASEDSMSQGRRARRIYVAGLVQGVGYRYFAHHAAEQIGVSGYAKNLADGRVEVYAVAALEQLDRFIAELRRGPRHASVEALVSEDADLLPDLAGGFTIESDD